MAKANYRERACPECSNTFKPTNSRNKFCSWQCRFRNQYKAFEEEQGCWKWPLSLNVQNGYGQFCVKPYPGIVMDTAHRLSYMLSVGPIPEGKIVLHSCDNRWCFNPAHLRAGTYTDNNLDMYQRNRRATSQKKIAQQSPEENH